MNSLQAVRSRGGYSLLLILLGLLATCVLGQTVSYAPAPDVNVSKIISFVKTSNDSFMTGSNRLEGLEVSKSTNTTTFRLVFFNRSMATNLNEYTIVDEPGQWEYVSGTRETLSCNLIYETTNQTYGLLLFQNDLAVFRIIARLPLETVRAALPASYSTFDYRQIASVFTPSENCVAGLFADKVFYLTSPTEATILGLPTGWNVAAYTESFEYGITDSKLYKMNTDTFQYDLIYTFEKFQTFTLKEKAGRMIITGANKTSNASAFGASGFFQKIYFFDSPASGLSLIGTITLNGSAHGVVNIPIYTSPQLTKMGYSYIPPGANASVQIFVKSIDYMNKQVIDITYDDPTHAYETFTTSGGQVDFSDYFLVVRNTSGLQNRPNDTVVEEAYQFVGNKIMFLDSRALTTDMELNKFRKMYVDRYFTNTLSLINVFDNTAGTGSDLYQVQYGNFADRRRIVPQAIPPFIQLPKPAGSTAEPSNPHNFTWSYYTVDATNPAAKKTKVDIFRINPFVANTHLDEFTKTVDGSFSMVARSTECRVLLEADTSMIVMFAYDQAISNQTMIYPLAGVVGALGVTPNNKWVISDDCDRFTVKNKAFYLSGNTFLPTNNTFGTTDTIQGDSKLNYIVSMGNVWRFDTTQNRYIQLTTDTPFTGTYSVSHVQDRLLISSKNFATSTWTVKVVAYVTSTTGVTSFFTYIHDFSGDFEPKVSVSNALDKVVIYGGKFGSTDVTGQVDAFLLDYAGRSNKTINFPMSTVRELEFTSILVNADFLYIRQSLDDAQLSNTTYTAIKRQEFVYFLNKGFLPQLLSQKELTTAQATSGFWTKSLIVTQDGVKHFLAVETVEIINNVENVIVRQTELNPQQAALSSLPNQAISGYVVDGKIVLCSPGCSDCSTQVCTGCKTGFAFNSNSAICVACAPGCLACDVNDPTKCSSCMNSTYLSGTQCLPCASTCITCSVSATSCTVCTPGQYYDGAQCQPCPRNCLTCSGASTCTQCNKGFVVTPAGTCRGCAITCSFCQANDIMACTACGKGLELIGSKCVQCSQNCLQCNSGSCQTCIPGYTTNSVGVCVPNCRLPCATCVDFQPSACLSCFASASLSSGTCVANLSCNTTSTCTDCGQGLNLFLLNGKCQSCSQIANIPNCIQCSQTNQQICSICQDGFYLNITGTCPSCPSACTTCVGDTLCTACQIGYTLPTDQSQGSCLQCASPCATCSGVVKFCTSCISGFTKQGWKCLNNTRIAFSLTLGGNVAAVMTNIDAIVSALLGMMGLSTTNVEVITITSITAGSAIITASASPPSLTTAATSLATQLASATTIGTLSVTSTTVTTTGATEEKSNVGLIIGLTVGLVGFAGVLIAIIVCVVKAKKRTGSESIGDSGMMGGKVVVNSSYEHKLDDSGSENELKPKPR